MHWKKYNRNTDKDTNTKLKKQIFKDILPTLAAGFNEHWQGHCFAKKCIGKDTIEIQIKIKIQSYKNKYSIFPSWLQALMSTARVTVLQNCIEKYNRNTNINTEKYKTKTRQKKDLNTALPL